jgi:hypothetical protein
MDINLNRRHLEGRPIAALLFGLFQELGEQLADCTILFDFPIYKDFDGTAMSVQALVAGPNYGLIVFGIIDGLGNVNSMTSDVNSGLQ